MDSETIFLLILRLLCSPKKIKGLKIRLITNEEPNDTILTRQDTRSALRRIVNPEWLATPEELSFWQHQPYTAVLKDFIHYYNFVNTLTEVSQERHNIYLNLITVHLSDYEHHRNFLRNTIQLSLLGQTESIKINTNDVIITFRLGLGNAEVTPTAFATSGPWRLPFVYYEKALADMLASRKDTDGRLIVCSDNFQDEYIYRLLVKYASQFPSGVILATWDTLAQFSCIVRARTIISSNSTFSVMGSILSDAETIYIPSIGPSGTIYPANDFASPDLVRIKDSARFKHISLP